MLGMTDIYDAETQPAEGLTPPRAPKIPRVEKGGDAVEKMMERIFANQQMMMAQMIMKNDGADRTPDV